MGVKNINSKYPIVNEMLANKWGLITRITYQTNGLSIKPKFNNDPMIWSKNSEFPGKDNRLVETKSAPKYKAISDLAV